MYVVEMAGVFWFQVERELPIDTGVVAVIVVSCPKQRELETVSGSIQMRWLKPIDAAPRATVSTISKGSGSIQTRKHGTRGQPSRTDSCTPLYPVSLVLLPQRTHLTVNCLVWGFASLLE
jgi:hypothetical protein